MGLAVETKGLTRVFGGFPAVDQLELQVERDTFYGFLGPNGAGKSTTIKMLTGLLAPSGGEARVLGRNMFDPRESLEAKQRIGLALDWEGSLLQRREQRILDIVGSRAE